MRRTILCAKWFLLAGALWASTGQAYVLPTDFLMREVAEHRRRTGLRDLSVQLQTEINNGESQIEERLYLKQPERMRLQRETTPEYVYVEKEGLRAEGTPKLRRLSGPPTDLLALLFFPKGDDLDQVSQHMVAGLRAAGIDITTVSLARNGDEVAYVVGAQPWEVIKPQVWIDKEKFVPVRCVFQVPTAGKTSKLEMRLSEYGSAVTGDFFPRVIESYRDNVLLRRAEVVSVQTNENLSESLFDLP
jgi:hypothetical protein